MKRLTFELGPRPVRAVAPDRMPAITSSLMAFSMRSSVSIVNKPNVEVTGLARLYAQGPVDCRVWRVWHIPTPTQKP